MSVKRFVAVLASLLFLPATSASGQDVGAIVELDGKATEVVARVGTAVVLKSLDSPLRWGYTRDEKRKQYPYIWYMVQDSSLGIVFRKRSGIKGSGRSLDGDIDLEALTNVRAIEIRAVTFNVWREFTGTVSGTWGGWREAGDTFSYNPLWTDYLSPGHKQLISIIFVARVLYEDGSITEADLQPVLDVSRRFSDVITKQDLTPETQAFEEA